MTEEEPHRYHTLGVHASQDVPVRGVIPRLVPCSVCGKPFKTHSEMVRHRDTKHHETKGHE